MFCYFLYYTCSRVLDYYIHDNEDQYIPPGDDLVIALRYRQQLYISMEEGLLVMNNDFFHPDSIDFPISISLRKIDPKYNDDILQLKYGIIVDGRPICSFGYLFDVKECDMGNGGEEKWILKGNPEKFVIMGRGGCLTVYSPPVTTDNFKHGVRIDTCDENENQVFIIKKNLI